MKRGFTKSQTEMLEQEEQSNDLTAPFMSSRGQEANRWDRPSAPQVNHLENMDAGARIMAQLPDQLHQYVEKPSGDIHDHFKSPNPMATMIGTICFPVCCAKMVLVQQGQIARVWHGDQPGLLGPGRHFLISPTSRLVGVDRLGASNRIVHGPIQIISVALGEIGIGTDRKTGSPRILTTGTHYINSPFFKWECFSDLTEHKTPIGIMNLVRVEKGYVGYGYSGSDGNLKIYQPGLHFIQPPDRYVDRLSMLIQVTQLPEQIHESKDYVQISVRAAIYYQIADPAKTLTTIQNIDDEIKELGISTLQQIIRSSALTDIAGTSQVSYSKKNNPQANGGGKVVKEGGVDFYDKIHDQFMANLHDVILNTWGVDISNIRIESLRIADKKLAQSIANQAIQVSEMEAKYMMLSKQTEIITVQANNEAKKKTIEVEAEAEVIKQKAEAEANAIVTRARAEKAAKILRGEGEAEYADLVNKNKLGGELAKLEIQAKALSGMKQIAYVPHLPNLLAQNNVTAMVDVMPKSL